MWISRKYPINWFLSRLCTNLRQLQILQQQQQQPQQSQNIRFFNLILLLESNNDQQMLLVCVKTLKIYKIINSLFSLHYFLEWFNFFIWLSLYILTQFQKLYLSGDQNLVRITKIPMQLHHGQVDWFCNEWNG